MTIPSFLAHIHQSLKPPAPPETIKRPRRALGTWTSVNEQIHSPFLTLLPAEIRNQIYIYLFTTSYSQVSEDDTTLTDSSPPPTSPLALLQTCRKIYLETALLAFRTHTFHIKGDSSFSALRDRTSHLPSPFFDAIASVSFTPQTWCVYNGGTRNTSFDWRSHAEIISNVLLLFPTLSRIDVRVKRGQDGAAGMKEARWFWAGLNVMCEGWKARVWGREEYWTWTGLNFEGNAEMGSNRGELGVKHCAGMLVQKICGREVRVCMVLAKEADLGPKGTLGLCLVPGMEGVGVEESRSKGGSVGFRFDPGEMYWGDLQNRLALSKRGVVDRGRDEEVPRVVERVRRGWLERWFRF
jgi:hypothetical protein